MRFALLCAGILACLATGCYNKPQTSLAKPGEGKPLSAGPSVGPGTTQGGSTAGPQPVVVKHEAPAAEHGAAEHGASAGEHGAAKN